MYPHITAIRCWKYNADWDLHVPVDTYFANGDKVVDILHVDDLAQDCSDSTAR